MANGAGKPKPAFFIAVLVVVAGLIGLAVMRCRGKSDDKVADTGSGSSGGGSAKSTDVEATPGQVTGLSATKYEYEPATTLPPVPKSSSYKALGKPRVVKMAVNVWAGWAPIVWANQGHKPGKVWKDAKGNEFKLELVLADDPVAMVNTYANGYVHIGWATVDMLPLIVNRLQKDPRTMPRIFQQVDWSNGGDGIVSRSDIKEIGDLRGKTVVLAQNSPSHFFLLNMLEKGGVNANEIKFQVTKDAFQAAQAYNTEGGIAACVSWAPDIYTLTENARSGNKLLVTTQTANKLIADVWFARADFAKDNPQIIESLVRGILDAVDDLKSDANKKAVGELLDTFYGLKPGTGAGMLGDAHWANWAENRDFFLVSNNPTNFERTFNTAKRLYKAARVDVTDLEFDQIVDFSVIKRLGNEAKYAAQKNTYEFVFTPKTAKDINVESTVATSAFAINFFPNSYDIWKKIPASDGKGDVFYDGKIEYTIENIAQTAGQFGTARILIEGHTDASMKGTADPQLVKELSLNRANAVKEGLLKKFPKLDPNQIVTAGYGWERPADPNDPDNHAKNRRVEVKIVPAEAQ